MKQEMKLKEIAVVFECPKCSYIIKRRFILDVKMYCPICSPEIMDKHIPQNWKAGNEETNSNET
jgi:predicted RNA-binding Zn-ribbon protein involved in translation (DUF1610 family)